MKSKIWEQRFREERKRVLGATATLNELQERLAALEKENERLHERLAEVDGGSGEDAGQLPALRVDAGACASGDNEGAGPDGNAKVAQ